MLKCILKMQENFKIDFSHGLGNLLISWFLHLHFQRQMASGSSKPATVDSKRSHEMEDARARRQQQFMRNLGSERRCVDAPVGPLHPREGLPGQNKEHWPLIAR